MGEGHRPGADHGAAAFQQHRVAPHAVQLPDSFVASHFPEVGPGVNADTGGVLRKNARLQGPDAMGFGCGDQRVQ